MRKKIVSLILCLTLILSCCVVGIVSASAETVPTKVEGLTATNVLTNQIDIEWTAPEGAEEYWIYVNGDLHNSSTIPEYSIDNCQADTEYSIFVTAKIGNTTLNKEDADVLVVKTLPETTDAPTDAPTDEPTGAPTDEPTDAPTETPTDEPTDESTETPTDEPTDNKIVAGYYLVGTLNGTDAWTIDALTNNRLLVPNPENEDELILDWEFNESDEIKVVYFNGTEFETWYNDGGDNYTISADKAGAGKLYFNPAGNENWDYFYFTIVPNSTDTPTVPDEETPNLFVKADGKCYPVKHNETYTYTYSLIVPDKNITSLDTTVNYDKDGLKMVLPVDEYGDLDTTAVFPVLGAATVSNPNEAEGKLIFNYSSVKGAAFNETKNVLVQIDFLVTAESGTYSIDTVMRSLFGADWTSYIEEYNTVNDSFVISTVLSLHGEPLVPVEPTEDPTDEPTEDPTDEPTEAPTDESTEAPTDEPTEAPTDEPTEAPTDEPTTSPATPGQSATNDQSSNGGTGAVQTGSTSVALVFLAVLIAAAGIIVVCRKKLS